MRDLFRLLFLCGCLFCAVLLATVPARASLNLIFPTPNHNLIEHPDEFYMRTVRSGPDPWKGGMYGFSRNAKRLKAGTVNTRFHEGMDIAPTMRDGRGNPLDTVVSIDEGTVVYVNSVAGRSNYGKYIIVQHIWDGSPFYSLYAHLNETWADSGQFVRQGDILGQLGYTGAGINRSRAHLHFEIGMLMNEHFQDWYNQEYGDNRNYHGFYNGINMAGLNVARLYERLAEEPNLTIREFIDSEHTPFYSVLLPRDGRLDLLSRYPWLLKKSADPWDPSWEITFDASGIPLSIVPSKKKVKEPTLASVESSPFPYKYVTKYRVSGSGKSAQLSGSGQRFIRMIATEQDSSTIDRGTRVVADASRTRGQTSGASANMPGGPDRNDMPPDELDEGEVEEGMADETVSDEVTAADETAEIPEAEEIDASASENVSDDEEEITSDEPMTEESVTDESVTESEDNQPAAAEAEESEPMEEAPEASTEEEEEDGGSDMDEDALEKPAAQTTPRSPAERGGDAASAPDGGESEPEIPISPQHITGHFFNWHIGSRTWSTDMQPVMIVSDQTNEYGESIGVDTVMARCDECAGFGLGSPVMSRVYDKTWDIHLAVVDKARLASKVKSIDGKIFIIELYIRSNGNESVSRVKLRTTVENPGPIFAPPGE